MAQFKVQLGIAPTKVFTGVKIDANENFSPYFRNGNSISIILSRPMGMWWRARLDDPDYTGIFEDGSTPEEAVGRLIIELFGVEKGGT